MADETSNEHRVDRRSAELGSLQAKQAELDGIIKITREDMRDMRQDMKDLATEVRMGMNSLARSVYIGMGVLLAAQAGLIFLAKVMN